MEWAIIHRNNQNPPLEWIYRWMGENSLWLWSQPKAGNGVLQQECQIINIIISFFIGGTFFRAPKSKSTGEMSLTSRVWEHCPQCPVVSRCTSKFRHYHPCFFWFSFPFLVCEAFEIHIAATCCPVFQAALNCCQGLLPEELMTQSLSFQPLARLEIHLGLGVGSKGPATLNPSDKPQ